MTPGAQLRPDVHDGPRGGVVQTAVCRLPVSHGSVTQIKRQSASHITR